jgi:uncharacterized ion transporter superfamily protein YfcC
MSGGPGGGERVRRVRVPHVYAIIFALLVLTVAASFVIPEGTFERDQQGRVIAGSFRFSDGVTESGTALPSGWQLLLALFVAPLRGIVAAADIIAFILVIGGTFKVIERTGAFEAAIHRTIERLRGREELIIPVAMLMFSIGGAVFGMGEEIIPFVMILAPLAVGLGYDRTTGAAIAIIGSQVGFAGAMFNPFTVGIAQGIAGLPPLSGWGYRTLCWLLLTIVAIVFVMLRSGSLKRAASTASIRAVGRRSVLLLVPLLLVVTAALLAPDELIASVAGPGLGWTAAVVAGAATVWLTMRARLTLEHRLCLLSLVAALAVIVWGISTHSWYVLEIGAIFLVAGLAAGVVARFGPSRIAECFLEGARDLVAAGLVVGFARGIVLLAEDLHMLDPILHGASAVLGEMPSSVALGSMFFFQSLLNFFVPSGSGQAALTMPIMAPLAELTGLTRQMAVLAFQFGDGFSNMIIPTSAVLMGSLEAGKVPYERWFAYSWPLQVTLALFALILLWGAVAIGFGP